MLDCLVVGGDSPIGQALATALRAAGLAVEWTSRRRERPRGAHLLDLETLDGADRLPAARHLALVAAETKFTVCQAETQRTHRINVDTPVALARQFLEHGSRILFFSSIAVHDGSVDRPDEAAEPHPNSVYGAQKRAAECALLALGGTIAILRPSKVVDPGFALWRGWLHRLRAGFIIEPFADMLTAPVSLRCLTDVARRLLTETAATGVFQWSAADQVSYAEVARTLAGRIDADGALVRPVNAVDRLDPRTLWLPAFARLGCTRLQEALGIAPLPSQAAIDDFLQAEGGGR